MFPTSRDVDSTDDLPSSHRNFRGFVKRLIWKSERKLQPATDEGIGFDNIDFAIQWRDILDPTPENLLALLLTGLLGLAVLQIFWQLLLVAIAITLAALKYSVIAAILITLLIVFL